MLCKVCTKEINTPIFETIGNQQVCCLSCVGLLQANNEDKCSECQRPVWKDSYYIINSLFYCSEKCKKKAVKNHLKKYNTIQDINIKHIQNDFYKNDSPMKSLKELRKEVKELYKDIDFDESSTIKSIPISSKSTLINLKEAQNNLKPINTNESTSNASFSKPTSIISNNNNNNFSIKYIKKYPVIPNRLSKESINRNNSFYGYDRPLSKKRNIDNFLKSRRNHSFDNHNRYLCSNNNSDEDIVFHLKYENKRNNYFTSNENSKSKKMKLKQTFLKLKNNRIPSLKAKIAKYQIPNPILNQYNLNGRNNNKYNNYRYYDSRFENNENKNYINIPYKTDNFSDKNYLKFNENNIKLNRNMNQNINNIPQKERNDYYSNYENYKYIDNSYF